MITINTRTKAITNSREHDPVIVNTPSGIMNQTPGYIRGWLSPRYPMPAIQDNHQLLARNMGKIDPLEWSELWEWASLYRDYGIDLSDTNRL